MARPLVRISGPSGVSGASCSGFTSCQSSPTPCTATPHGDHPAHDGTALHIVSGRQQISRLRIRATPPFRPALNRIGRRPFHRFRIRAATPSPVRFRASGRIARSRSGPFPAGPTLLKTFGASARPWALCRRTTAPNAFGAPRRAALGAHGEQGTSGWERDRSRAGVRELAGGGNPADFPLPGDGPVRLGG